jgi:hypothetical protein
MQTPLERLATFTADSLPTLDEVVLGVLEYYETQPLPTLPTTLGKRPLVIGSVNALRTGEIMWENDNAICVDESRWEDALRYHPDRDHLIIISASGGKHAVTVAETATAHGLPVTLITSNPNPPAAKHLAPHAVVVLPRLREPYTYNTSTYLGMILAKTQEPLSGLGEWCTDVLAPALAPYDLGAKTAYTLVVPNHFPHHRGMFMTKFDELFGSLVCGRAFTTAEMLHAKTVVPNPQELIITWGDDTRYTPHSEHCVLPVPPVSGPAAFLAVGYYLIGHLQRAHPPYFQQSIHEFTDRAGSWFATTINPIVE